MKKKTLVLFGIVFFVAAGMMARNFRPCCFDRKPAFEIEPLRAGNNGGGFSEPQNSPTGHSPDGSSLEESTLKSNAFYERAEFPEEELTKEARISVGVLLPLNHGFTEGQKLGYEIRARNRGELVKLENGKLDLPAKNLPITFDLEKTASSEGTLEIDLRVSYCSEIKPKLCKFKLVQAIQPYTTAVDGKANLEMAVQIT